MNLLLSLALSLFMSAAATPSNPDIQEIIEASNTELEGQGYATYEETADGAAVVYVLYMDGDETALEDYPVDAFREQYVATLLEDEDTAEGIADLFEEGVSLVIRLMTSDGAYIDIPFTADDFE